MPAATDRPAGAADRSADVIVVGGGPAGATAAFYLATAGVDVLVLEKSAFPREKVCGDGLTPRAVKALVAMGIDTSPEAGWAHNKGLRILGGGHRLELPWPDLAAYPGYGLVRPRQDFDTVLARHAEKAGARLMERTTVTGPVVGAAGRILGVTAQPADGGPAVEYRAPLVLACDGNSSRLSLAVGLNRREDRPLGVAVRRYYTSPRTDDDYLESWLELWAGEPGASDLLPGYGWVFGVGDGTSNVGVGMLNTSRQFQNLDYRGLMRRWLAGTPPEWGFVEANATGPIRGAALPMGFNRQPHYRDGMLLVGDAAGVVNPFNGEGIAYAMESAALAAEVVAQALDRPAGPARERVLGLYPKALKDAYGGYYTLGRIFVRLIGNAQFMTAATKHGLNRPMLMRFTLKLLANLTDPKDGDVSDRLINALSAVAPAA